jgi:hypothetical protein
MLLQTPSDCCRCTRVDILRCMVWRHPWLWKRQAGSCLHVQTRQARPVVSWQRGHHKCCKPHKHLHTYCFVYCIVSSLLKGLISWQMLLANVVCRGPATAAAGPSSQRAVKTRLRVYLFDTAHGQRPRRQQLPLGTLAYKKRSCPLGTRATPTSKEHEP